MKKGDSEIHEILMRNEEKAFRLLFDRYYSGLCIVAQFYTENPVEAEDLVQQFFIKLWEEKYFKNINGSFQNYLMTGIRNQCINFVKKKKTNRKRMGQLPNEKEIDQSFDFLLNDEEQAIFNKAISELPEQSRKSVELVYFSNQSYKDAADQLNVSVNTIKSHLKNGLRKLKNNSEINRYFEEKN
jgi:RNA polymerase sigma-70 factor (ECF subfamily)